MLWIPKILLGVYGLLIAAANGQLLTKREHIAVPLLGMLGALLTLIAPWLATPLNLWLAAIGLLLIQVQAILTGALINGKIHWSHHLIRLIVHLALFCILFVLTR
ncbi:hypothetical protein PQ472_11470 [Lacticaseibacillus pabuli]|uniref:Uncharacterized protein n=1 Tax=Lacticaseibacillus pabuli TaxID=3025672 RepID=A0ABY7WQN6_9LACO|nr:hypothetical protein [Lacticaseibacillus sp. KACC 23028]WDF82497.1 hypothetical protein PQ472_11470 [Lacticaseibacillus sp. KACC 23028]